MMHNFKIFNNEGQYKLCLHPYKLIFTGVTIVIEVDLPNIPLKAYEFVNFVDILARTYRRDLLVGNAIYCQTSFNILYFLSTVILFSKDVYELLSFSLFSFIF